MVVRGAPAIGIAAAYGIALAAAHGRGPRRRPTQVLRAVAADGRQPRLGARRDACRPVGRARPGDPSRRGRALPGDGRARRRAARAGHARAHPLQRRRARDGRLRQRRRRAARRLGARPARARLGRRDAAAAAGRAAHGLGARDRRDPARRDRRLGRGVADGGRRGRRRRSPAPTGSPRTATPRTRSAPTASRCSPAYHGIPFYVVAPSSTVDHAIATGAEIPIEERDPAEVTARFPARNPAFDVTPAALITAIVTEHGVHRPPYVESLAGAVVAA